MGIETARARLPPGINLGTHHLREEASSGETNYETANIVNLESSTVITKSTSADVILSSSQLMIKDEAGSELFDFTTGKV